MTVALQIGGNDGNRPWHNPIGTRFLKVSTCVGLPINSEQVTWCPTFKMKEQHCKNVIASGHGLKLSEAANQMEQSPTTRNNGIISHQILDGLPSKISMFPGFSLDVPPVFPHKKTGNFP